MSIRYVSTNKDKFREAKSILEPMKISILPFETKIDELQTKETQSLVEDKVLKAFNQVGRKVFVDHTGLYLECLNGFPGGLTQVFWDTLEADRFAELYGNNVNTRATAKTVIGYTDCQEIHTFEGEIKGRIAQKPSGDRSFQWDCVFIPDGSEETFAVMGEQRKNEISMRRIALDEFAKFLANQDQDDR